MMFNSYICLYAQLKPFLVYNMHTFSISPKSKASKCHLYTVSSKWGRGYEYSSPHLCVATDSSGSLGVSHLTLEIQVLRSLSGA